MQGSGGLFQQSGKQLVYRIILNEVIIIQHQDKRFFNLIEFVDQAAGQDLHGWEANGIEHTPGFLAGVGKNSLNSGHKIGEEKVQVAVIFIQGYPGAGDFNRLRPTTDKGAFAITGRC